MRFPLNVRFSAITALLVFGLEFISVLSLQNGTSHITTSNVVDFEYDKKNTTLKNVDHASVNRTHDLSNNGTFAAENVAGEQKNGVTKRIKKRRKVRKNRIQHKGTITLFILTTRTITLTTESSGQQSSRNQTDSRLDTKRKRKRKYRRRKNRKNRRKQQKLENSNILEVTTAKEVIFPTNTNSNSTINELIRKLNENPEDNFDEFRIIHSNKNNNTKGANMANLVAPIPISSKFTATLHNNITLHINTGNDTNYKTSIKRNNRCRKRNGGCAHICNPRSKIKCSCLTGFALAADQRACWDIDECKVNNGDCEKECRNTLGTYECHCPSGLRLADDLKSCEDINECLLRNGHGPCQDTCENTFGSYKCSCRGLDSTFLGEDGHTCEDINECIKDNGGCSHNCINTLRQAFCSCPDGMELSSDWKTCQDINECEDDSINTSCRNCINTEGSYGCIDTADYQSDQPSGKITCKPLFLPPIGFISCSRDGAQKSYAKTGRERIINSPGTICKMECPIGFRMVGHFYVTCGSFGMWEGKTDAKCIRVEAPTLLCPTTQVFKVDKISKKAVVIFPSPKTNINWKYVTSHPSWAKELTGSLKAGHYNMNFIARDPNSKLSSSCTFKIIVNN